MEKYGRHDDIILEYTVTVEKKTPEHRFYGKGYDYGYSVNPPFSGLLGVSDPQGTTMVWRQNATIRITLKDTRGHPFYISTESFKGGNFNGGIPESPFREPERFRAKDNGVLEFVPSRDFKNSERQTLFYCCDIHEYMGGTIVLAPEGMIVEEPLADPVQLRFGKKKKKKKKRRRRDIKEFKNRLQMGGFDRPTFGVHSYHSDKRFLYVGEQGGSIWEIDLFTTVRGDIIDDPEGHAGKWAYRERIADLSYLQPSNVRSGQRQNAFDERGLLGMAIVPYRYTFVKGEKRPGKGQDGPKTPVSLFIFSSASDESVGGATYSEGVDHASCVYHFTARYNFSNEGLSLATERGKENRILCVPEPYVNHNGGNLIYDEKTRYLYVGLGDGGSQGDPDFRVQRKTTAMGKVLRLDVSQWIIKTKKKEKSTPNLPYEIPPNNVFARRKGRGIYGVTVPIFARQSILVETRLRERYNYQRSKYDLQMTDKDRQELTEIDIKGLESPLPEVYLWGVRNPWGISFQPETMDGKKLSENGAKPFAPDGAMILTDNGEDRTEEINIIPKIKKGQEVDMGWPWFEGTERTLHHRDKKVNGALKRMQFPPAIVYHHGEKVAREYQTDKGEKDLYPLFGRGVIGGYVYTGTFSPQLYGSYVFGDVTGWYAAVKKTSESGGGGSGSGKYELVAYGKLPDGHYLRAFLQLHDGEIYAMSQNMNKEKDDGIFHIFL